MTLLPITQFLPWALSVAMMLLVGTCGGAL
jgi:hypothetical protein